MSTTSIKKNSKNKLSLFYLVTFTIFFCVFHFANAQGLVPCGMGNDTNNACTLCHLIIGIYGIINWAKTMLITVAAVGIFVSGVMYIISSGDEGMVTKAKGFLKNSILGFVIVLMSWFFVNTIMWVLSAENFGVIGKKNWYTFDCSTKTSTHIISTPQTTTPSGGTGGKSASYQKACPSGSGVANFSGATTDSSINLNNNCNNYNFTNSYGVNPKILKTIAQVESSCGANKGTSTAHACGLMQLLPATANVSCNELIANDDLSINLAAKYISDYQSSHKNDPQKILAGYNSGYASGGKGGLAPSVDCPGNLKFQCCTNPGELDETISYVWNGIGIYNKL